MFWFGSLLFHVLFPNLPSPSFCPIIFSVELLESLRPSRHLRHAFAFSCCCCTKARAANSFHTRDLRRPMRGCLAVTHRGVCCTKRFRNEPSARSPSFSPHPSSFISPRPFPNGHYIMLTDVCMKSGKFPPSLRRKSLWQRRWYELSFAGSELRESTLSRSRQVTGCIVLLRQCDLVKEIGQTCGRSATMRPER